MKHYNDLTDAEKLKIFNNAIKDPEIRAALDEYVKKQPKETQKTDSVIRCPVCLELIGRESHKCNFLR
jgi:hypothetical protein